MGENFTISSRNRWSTNILNQYSSHSTITGIQYLAEPRRPLIERIFWIIMFLAMTIICVKLTWESYIKWKDSPVLISPNNQFSSVLEIPFPAVTICPHQKFNMTKKNMTDFILRLYNKYLNMTDENNQLIFEVAQQICPALNEDLLRFFFITFPDKYVDPDIFMSTMIDLSPTYKSIFLYRFWETKDIDGEFQPFLHKEGICFTFNSLDTSDIFRNGSNPHKILLDKLKYQLVEHKKSSPFNGTRSGKGSGFRVQMLNDLDNNCEICQEMNQGAEIAIHSPDEVPDFTNYVSINGKKNVLVSITPRVMQISDGLKYVDFSKRQCYLKNEKYLQHFKIYTQANCEFECLTNLTLKMCGCVKFYMPRNETTKFCTRENYCTSTASENLSFWP
uniref:Uncharacterized protein n=1 Tax=Megaselia scalaris TaxID=36166 RepID=T1GN76_MEGSC